MNVIYQYLKQENSIFAIQVICSNNGNTLYAYKVTPLLDIDIFDRLRYLLDNKRNKEITPKFSVLEDVILLNSYTEKDIMDSLEKHGFQEDPHYTHKIIRLVDFFFGLKMDFKYQEGLIKSIFGEW